MRAAFVAETLPRETIYLAQTPQAFRARCCATRWRSAERARRDRRGVARRAGRAPVRIVDGEPTNIKITTPRRSRRGAEAIRSAAVRRPRTDARVGTGYDLHRLVAAGR